PSSIRQSNYGGHPLERLEKTRLARDEYRDFQILRSVQGIQAPLRQLAERKSAANIGRLSFLPSSNLMHDVLTGNDELIMPENIFNQPSEFCEVSLPPHMVMERKLNIL
ncbi:proteasome maturation protein-like protein, partial [Euroglyphus maynei]